MRKKLPQALYQIIANINSRHRILERAGFSFELYDIFEENLNIKNEEYGKIISDLFFDRSSSLMTRHIYDSNDWLHQINKNLYKKLAIFPTLQQRTIFNDIKINYKVIVAQANSLIARPNIVKPIDYNHSSIKEMEEAEEGYIRIGYFEKQLYTEDRSKEGYKEKVVYGGIVFEKNMDFPYSSNRLNIKEMYSLVDTAIFISEENPVVSYMQTLDMFENYKILWFENELIKILGLNIGNFTSGLYATNDNNEIILKFSCWSSNYLGIDLRGEIPEFSGSQLLLRKDYLDELIKIYNKSAYYLVYTK